LACKNNNKFSEEQYLRYSRHIKLEQFGVEAQLKLKYSSVLIVGAGGLGNPVGLYLAGAGIGTIGVVDLDCVSLSNLHRQIAFKTSDIGQSKVDCLIGTMSGLNPDINFVAHRIRLDAENVEEVICNYDLVIDGTDNFSTRFLLGDACYLQKIALLHGAIHQFQAQVVLFNQTQGRTTSCFRCLYREPPDSAALPSCSEAGILNVVTGATGLLMASEALKYLAGLPTPSLGSVLVYDALQQSIRCLKLNKETDCPLCGEEPSIRSVSSALVACNPLANFYGEKELEISVERAKHLLEAGALLIDVRTPVEFARDSLTGAISIPLDILENGGSAQIPRNQTVVAYCQSGVRSLAAANKLRALGYTNIYSVTGGITAWNQFAPRTA